MAKIHLRQEPNLFGERLVLNNLRNLSSEWDVFYSVGFLDRKGFDRQREIDFVAVHSVKGIVFIEVKGGKVQFSGGVVSQFLDGDWKTINPVVQLNDARRVCLEYLKSRGVSGFLSARNMYVFPHVSKPKNGLSQEIEDCSIFEGELSNIVDVVESSGETNTRPIATIEKVLDLLENCLVYKSGYEENPPDRDLTPLKSITLREILATSGQSFSNVENAKRALTSKREALQELWVRTITGVSEIETYGHEFNFEKDALVQLLHEVQLVLSASTVDIGVFGQVKRGKSTLVNALVGREVSATGILPKTGVPVYVEHSKDDRGTVFLEDGTSRTMTLEEAVEMTTQEERKRRQKSSEPLVDHVVVGLSVGWLPRGVRIVDTPGLSDPSLSDDYESYAMNELNRVGAAILVVSYPPGPEQHEVKLIRKLAQMNVSKVFFVINMFSDHWKRKQDRSEARDYLLSLIRDAQSADHQFRKGDDRVFVINCALAEYSQRSEKQRDLEKSNILELMVSLETFLSGGVLERISSSAATKLLACANVILRTLVERESLLEAPHHLLSAKDELSRSIRESEKQLDDIVDRAEAKLSNLGLILFGMVTNEFERIRNQIGSTRVRRDLKQIEASISIRAASLSSSLITTFQQSLSKIAVESREEVVDSTGNSSWTFSGGAMTAGIFSVEIADGSVIADYRPPTEFRTQGRAAGGVIGAMLGGGTGIALAATGAIGLIIGGLFGILVGDSIADGLADRGNSLEATQDEVLQLLETVRSVETSMRIRIERAIHGTSLELSSSLKTLRSSVVQHRQVELQRIEKLLKSKELKERALLEIRSLRVELLAITGQ